MQSPNNKPQFIIHVVVARSLHEMCKSNGPISGPTVHYGDHKMCILTTSTNLHSCGQATAVSLETCGASKAVVGVGYWQGRRGSGSNRNISGQGGGGTKEWGGAG